MSDEKIRTISANDMHVIMATCLSVASHIHTAMFLFDDDNAAQSHLNEATHAALIGTEQCRQLHKSTKRRLAPPPKPEEPPQ